MINSRKNIPQISDLDFIFKILALDGCSIMYYFKIIHTSIYVDHTYLFLKCNNLLILEKQGESGEPGKKGEKGFPGQQGMRVCSSFSLSFL